MITNKTILTAKKYFKGKPGKKSTTAINLILKSYEPMVINVAVKLCELYSLWGIDDLMSVGNIAILKAIEGYKIKGDTFSFPKYLYPRVHGEIKREILKTYRTVRRPEALCWKNNTPQDKSLSDEEFKNLGNFYSI